MKIFKSQDIKVQGSKLKITLSGVNFETLPNLTRFDLIICQNLPCGSNTNEVILSDGVKNVKAYNLSGNLLRADQLKCRRCYPMIYGNDEEHVSMRRLLRNTVYSVCETNSDKKGD